MKNLITLICIVFMFSLQALGQSTISFQGKLLDSGAPVDGSRDFTFSIPSLDPDWTETHTGVPVVDGLYSVTLGSISPLPQLFNGVSERDLLISVGADVLSPVTLRAPYQNSFFQEQVAVLDANGNNLGGLETQDDGAGGTEAVLRLEGTDGRSFTMSPSGVDGSDIRQYTLTTDDGHIPDANGAKVGYLYEIENSEEPGSFRGIQLDLNGTGTRMGIRSNVNSTAGDTGNKWGFISLVLGEGSGEHAGVLGQAFNSTGQFTNGVRGIGVAPGDGTTESATSGVSGFGSSNLNFNNGGFFEAAGTAGSGAGVQAISSIDNGTDVDNFGIRASAQGSGINRGVYGEAFNGAENWAGWFEGPVKVNEGNIEVSNNGGGTILADLKAEEAVDGNGDPIGEQFGLMTLAESGSGRQGRYGSGSIRFLNTDFGETNGASYGAGSASLFGIDDEINMQMVSNWMNGGTESANRGALFMWGDQATKDATGVDIFRVALNVRDDGFGKDVGWLALGGPHSGGSTPVGVTAFVEAGAIPTDENGDTHGGQVVVRGVNSDDPLVAMEIHRDPDGTERGVLALKIRGAGGDNDIYLDANAFNNGGNSSATFQDLHIANAAADDSVIDLNNHGPNGNLGSINMRDSDDSQDGQRLSMSVNDFGNGSFGELRLHGPVINSNVGAGECDDPSTPEVVEPCVYAQSFVDLQVTNDPGGSDPNGWSGRLNLQGTSSPNMELGAHQYRNNDLPYMRMFGSEEVQSTDENGDPIPDEFFHPSLIEFDVQRDDDTGQEFGQIWLHSTTGESFHIDALNGIGGGGNNFSDLHITNSAGDNNVIDLEHHGPNGNLGAIGLRDTDDPQDGHRINLSVNDFGSGSFGEMSLHGPIFDSHVGNGECDDPATPEVVEPCLNVRSFVNFGVNNDPGGSDPSGWHGRMSLQGTSSPNVEIGAHQYRNNDLPVVRMYGSETVQSTDENGDPIPDEFYHPTLVEFDVQRDDDTGQEYGQIWLYSTTGESFQIDALNGIGSGGNNFSDLHITNEAGDNNVIDMNWGGPNGNLGTMNFRDADDSQDGQRINLSVNDFGSGSFGELSIHGPVYDSNVGNGECDDPSTPAVVEPCVNAKSFVNLGINNDQGGSDPGGWHGRLYLQGTNSPNIELGAHQYQNNDLPFIRMYGAAEQTPLCDHDDDPGTAEIPCPFFPSLIELDVVDDTPSSREIGQIRLNSTDGETMNIGAAGISGGNNSFDRGFNLNMDASGGPILEMHSGSNLNVNINGDNGSAEFSGQGTFGDAYDNGVAINHGFPSIVMHSGGGGGNSDNGTQTVIIDGDNGEATFIGSVTAQSFPTTSDKRLKRNISTIEEALDNTLKLRGVSYQWKDSKRSDRDQIGLIAQEVEEVYPEFVHTDSEGMKAVNYAQMVAVLIESIKELNAKIEALNSENTALKASLEMAEANSTQIQSLTTQLNNLQQLINNLATQPLQGNDDVTVTGQR